MESCTECGIEIRNKAQGYGLYVTSRPVCESCLERFHWELEDYLDRLALDPAEFDY